MSTKARVAWSFEDASVACERILRDYARWRLDSLPFLQDAPLLSEALVEGYRRLDAARAETAQRFITASHCRRAGACSAQRREAGTAWALWDLAHRWLVAMELDRLHQTTSGIDELRLVLMAEQRVESFWDESGGAATTDRNDVASR